MAETRTATGPGTERNTGATSGPAVQKIKPSYYP